MKFEKIFFSRKQTTLRFYTEDFLLFMPKDVEVTVDESKIFEIKGIIIGKIFLSTCC